MKHLLSNRYLHTVCAISLSLPLIAAAESHPDATSVTNVSTNIPPVIVEASRAFRRSEEIASHVTVITGTEIAKRNRRDVIDVLRKDAGIFIRSLNSNPAQSQISMRGFGANSHGRVLIMVDGERLNNPDMSAPNLLRVPLSSIERIEVMHGSQSVLYGDYAAAGVINIVTLAPGDKRTTLSASGGSHNTFTAGANHRGRVDEDVSYNADMNWNTSDGYRNNGDHESWNARASITKEWKEDVSVGVSAFYHDSEFGLPGSLNYSQFQRNPRQSATPDDESRQKQRGMSIRGQTGIGDEGILDANISLSRRESETDWQSTGGATDFDIDDYALALKYTTPWDLADFSNKLTLGFDTRMSFCDGYNHFAAIPYFAPATDRYWSYDRTSIAGYFSEEFFITEKLSLLAGARAEIFRNRIKGARALTSNNNEEYSYETALLYRPVEKTKLFARAVRYYHAPFVDEVIDTYTGLPDTSLESERGYTFESGASIDVMDHLNIAATVYHMQTQDEIYYDTLAYKNVNAPDDTSREGIDASIKLHDDQIGSIGVIYNYVRAHFSEGVYDNNRIPMVPKQVVRLNGELKITDEITALATMNHVSSQRLEGDFSNSSPKLLKPYTTLDIGVSYEPSRIEGLRLFAGVDNLFDKKYANYGGYFYSQWSGGHNYYYYPADARTWKIAVAYTF